MQEVGMVEGMMVAMVEEVVEIGEGIEGGEEI